MTEYKNDTLPNIPSQEPNRKLTEIKSTLYVQLRHCAYKDWEYMRSGSMM
jgi:hypothetical protein